MTVYPQNDTTCVHGGIESDPIHGALLTPVVQSTAFEQPSVEDYLKNGYSYSRSGNPTVSVLERKVGAMEGAKMPAVTAGTGMSALHIIMNSFLRKGDHVVITQCSYGGTNRASRVLYAKNYGIEFSYVDMTDLKAVEAAIRPGQTKMILSETPCNPTIQLADVRAISDLAKAYTEKNRIAREASGTVFEETLQDGDGPSRMCLQDRVLHVCDSTLSPPPVMRVLDHGCDVSLVSMTKYYDGHNMYTGGAACTNEEALYNHLKFMQNVLGVIIHPLIAFGFLQNMKTLNVRVLQQSRNAMAVAKFLAKHPAISAVNYPGLEQHKQHSIALKQHSLYPEHAHEKEHTAEHYVHGSMISFELKGGTAVAKKVMNNTQPPFVLAENLGSVESIITCPAVFTHGNMPREARLAVGITDGLIRLSVGMEDIHDLLKGLEATLSVAL